VTTVLVVAKAPRPGRVKTRLGAEVGPLEAARLAAAALLDTLTACTAAVGPQRCHLALDGDLDGAERGAEIRSLLSGWTVTDQRGAGLGERLAHAHRAIGGPVVQIGMDTPQVTPGLLAATTDGLSGHDAVLAPAADGGWWALALRDPGRAAALRAVPMSTPTTYDDTRAALRAGGSSVAGAPLLRDVDTRADAEAVAAAAPDTEFARAWRALTGAPA
jgi:glycosyltransferase A (GT-A) superfamily protein (DUF2064 family)